MEMVSTTSAVTELSSMGVNYTGAICFIVINYLLAFLIWNRVKGVQE